MFGKEYIYIIQMGDSDYYKIGRTTDMKYRLKSLQTGNPFPLTIKAFFTTTNKWVRQFENIFHTELSYCRCTGEWFCFSCHEVKVLTNLAELYKDMILSDFDMLYIKGKLEKLKKEVEIENIKIEKNKNNFLKKLLTKIIL